MYHVQILKGLMKPGRSFYQLAIAEKIRGFRPRVVWLAVLGMIIFATSALYGVGSESLSAQITDLSPQIYELKKLAFAGGRVLLGLVVTAAILLLPSLLFKLVTANPYVKLVILQLYVLPIFLLANVINMVLAIWAGLPWFSSPLSLGVIGQMVTANDLLIYLLGSISIFQIVVMMVQYRGLRQLNPEMRGRNIFYLVLGVHVLYWVVHALYQLINLG